MTFPIAAFAVYAGAFLFFAAAWLFGRNKIRTLAGDGMLIALSFFVAHFLYFAIASQKIGKSNPEVHSEASDIQLKLISYYDSLRRHSEKDASSIFGKTFGPPKGGPSKTEEKQRLEGFQSNEKALEEAIAKNPKNARYYAKLIILLADDPNATDKEERIAKATSALMQGGWTDDAQHVLAQALTHIYIKKEVEKSEVDSFAGALKSNLPGGWYLDHAMEKLYAAAHEKTKLEQYQEDVDVRNILALARIIAVAIFVVFLAFVGLINIVIQLALTPRSAVPKPDAVGLSVRPKTIWAVFVSWFSLQILMSSAAHLVIASYPQLTKQPDMVALTTMVSYLATNIPGLLLIYFLALKPNGVTLRQGLKLTARTSTGGPFKVILAGILAGCSAIPLVLITALLAHKFFNVQGSDNPVISQIIQAASSTNPLAIIIFYFTIAVMAPFFEEILFRGFLYAGLKPKIGMFFAMLASALTFAALHLDKGGALMLFAIGLVLAFTYERSRSLYASMIAHGLWNGGVFTVVLLIFSS